jgi:hypothetical protein
VTIVNIRRDWKIGRMRGSYEKTLMLCESKNLTESGVERPLGSGPIGSLPTVIKQDTMMRRRRNEKDHFHDSNAVSVGVLQWLGDSARAV